MFDCNRRQRRGTSSSRLTQAPDPQRMVSGTQRLPEFDACASTSFATMLLHDLFRRAAAFAGWSLAVWRSLHSHRCARASHSPDGDSSLPSILESWMHSTDLRATAAHWSIAFDRRNSERTIDCGACRSADRIRYSTQPSALSAPQTFLGHSSALSLCAAVTTIGCGGAGE